MSHCSTVVHVLEYARLRAQNALRHGAHDTMWSLRDVVAAQETIALWGYDRVTQRGKFIKVDQTVQSDLS